MAGRRLLGARRLGLVVAILGALTATFAGAAPALAGTPWWHVAVTAAPTNLPPGGEGQISLTAINVGDGNVTATGANKVTVTDNLPSGLEANTKRAPDR